MIGILVFILKTITTLLLGIILSWLYSIYKPFFKVYSRPYVKGLKAAEQRYKFTYDLTEIKGVYCNRHADSDYWDGYLDYINYCEERGL